MELHKVTTRCHWWREHLPLSSWSCRERKKERLLLKKWDKSENPNSIWTSICSILFESSWVLFPHTDTKFERHTDLHLSLKNYRRPRKTVYVCVCVWSFLIISSSPRRAADYRLADSQSVRKTERVLMRQWYQTLVLESCVSSLCRSV